MQDSNEHTEVLRNIPLIPLRDLVVFPATLVPFIVGRSSSIQALEKAAEKDKMIFLAAQMDASVDNPTPKDIYSVGVTAKIIRTIKSDDRNMKVIVEGKGRARIVEYLSTYPFYQILAKGIKEVDDHLPESRELLKRVLALFEDYLKLNQNTNLDSIIPALRENTPERISDIIASHVYMPLEEKQNLLETVNSFERLRRLNYVLENEILKIHSAYQKDPNRGARRRGSFKDQPAGQKPFPPGAPGGRKEDQPNEIEELRQKVAKAKMPADAEEKAYKEIERLESMPPMSAEATVSRNYLDWLISLPWVKKTREKRELKEAERILNEDHHGLDKVKERILEYLSIRQLVKNPRGVILGLIGPPGVGKSSLGKSIARATGRKFVRLSLGGVRDEAEIRGHRRTYIGAFPGQIIQRMKKAGTVNPVFLLDEVDKMSMDFRGDPSAALLEVLDPEQNNAFVDHYLDVEYDLSKVMFIATANVVHTIPAPLKDRMEIIALSGYTHLEKLAIGKQFLVPKQRQEQGLEEAKIHFEDSALEELIDSYTREAGVRNLEREVGSVLRKVARQVLQHGPDYTLTVDRLKVRELLGKAKYRTQQMAERGEVGLATGLAWTEVGGEILSTEVALSRGKGNLTLTGKLGDVMQESARAALSYVRSRAELFGLDPDFHASLDIHIHVPEGAIPKDGPSAGITMATALLSAVTKIPVHRDIAMTGEITLRGKVLPVGGVKDKILAAIRAGITRVILPADNERDLEEIPADVREKMEFHLVESMDEVVSVALDGTIVPLTAKTTPEPEKAIAEPSVTH